MARKIETTIAMDGEQKFKQGMDSAARAMRVLESEGRALAASLAAEGDAATQAAAKQKNLQQQIEQQKQIITALEQAVKDAAKAYGDNSKEVDGYAIKLNNARTKLANLQKTLKSADKEVEELGRDSIQAGRQLQQGISEGAQQAEGDLKSMMETMQDSLSAIQGSTAVTAIKTIWDTAKGAYQAVDGYVTGTQDYRRQLSYLLFNAQNDSYGLEDTRDMLVEVQAMTADAGSAIEGLSNLMQIKFPEQTDLEVFMRGLLGASVKWPDTLKFESLSDSLQETLATGALTGQVAELFERMNIDIEAVNEALKKSDTYEDDIGIIRGYMQSKELTDAYNEYREKNGALIKELETVAKLEYESARVGAVLARNIWTPVKEKGAETMTWIADVLETWEKDGFQGAVAKVNEEFAKPAIAQMQNEGRSEEEIAAAKAVLSGTAGNEETVAILTERAAGINGKQGDVRNAFKNALIGMGLSEETVNGYFGGLENIKNWTINALKNMGMSDGAAELLFGDNAEEGSQDKYLGEISDMPVVNNSRDSRADAVMKTLDMDAYYASLGSDPMQDEYEQFRQANAAWEQYNATAAEAGEEAGEMYGEMLREKLEGALGDFIDTSNMDEPVEALHSMPVDESGIKQQMEDAGKEGGEALLDGIEEGADGADEAAAESGAAFAVSYARGMMSKVSYVTSMASAMGAAAARAAAQGAAAQGAGGGSVNVSINVDGRQLARATAPYMSQEMVALGE